MRRSVSVMTTTAPDSRSSVIASRLLSSRVASSLAPTGAATPDQHDRGPTCTGPGEQRAEVGVARDQDLIVFACLLQDSGARRGQEVVVAHMLGVVPGLSQRPRELW
jgi:hypothetical protein